uniref:Uncharacterized protein n=1 Tax=Oryza brachyantha TaxID=4533 RepID=J3LL12_ORYBR
MMHKTITDNDLRCPDIEIIKHHHHSTNPQDRWDTKEETMKLIEQEVFLSSQMPTQREGMEIADISTRHQFRPPVCLYSLHRERFKPPELRNKPEIIPLGKHINR